MSAVPPSVEAKSPLTASPYLTAADIAAMLKVSSKTVYRIANEDATFPALRLVPGGSFRVHREQLQRWLDARTQGRQRRST